MPSDPSTDDVPVRTQIEIVGLGRGPRGFRSLRLDGAVQPEATLLMDLHSAIRVRIGERVYDETDADIRIADS